MYVNVSLVEFKHSITIGSITLDIIVCRAEDTPPKSTRTRKQTEKIEV